MQKSNVSTAQGDFFDEIYLAVVFLNQHNRNFTRMSKAYHVSSKTWAAVLAGRGWSSWINKKDLKEAKVKEMEKKLTTQHAHIFSAVISELDLMRQELVIFPTKRELMNEVKEVMLEVTRVYVGRQHNPEIWSLYVDK